MNEVTKIKLSCYGDRDRDGEREERQIQTQRQKSMPGVFFNTFLKSENNNFLKCFLNTLKQIIRRYNALILRVIIF